MKKPTVLLGAHISIAGGHYKAIIRGEKIGCTTIQIFTKSNKTWYAKAISQANIKLFKKTLTTSSISPKIMAHSAYLINLASKDSSIRNKSIVALKEEVARCNQLGIPYLILHPGAHGGEGENKGIKKIAAGLDDVLKSIEGSTMILLETMAGQGTSIGSTFESLRTIYDTCSHKKRIGICFDTCHVFSAGYGLETKEDYEKTWKHFKKTIGIKLLKAIHLNDSKGKSGCKKDRHAHIGTGEIPTLVFKRIMNDKNLASIPKILETPLEEKYEEEINLLKSFTKKASVL